MRYGIVVKQGLTKAHFCGFNVSVDDGWKNHSCEIKRDNLISK